MQDITEGMRMAQKSGLTETDAVEALFAYCGNCNAGLAIGGDKVMLKDRSGPKAIYWCRACVSKEYEAEHNKPLSSNEFKRMSAVASKRPFMTANGIARTALYKLTRDTFGDGSQASVNKMRENFAAGLDAAAMAKFKRHVRTRRTSAATAGRCWSTLPSTITTR